MILLLSCVRKESQTKKTINVITKIGGVVVATNEPPKIVYDTARIGTQIWMTKNLDITTFRNGDSIYHAKTKKEWLEAGKKRLPAYYIYIVSEKEYKRQLLLWDSLSHRKETERGNWIIPKHREYYLYNAYAVLDARGLAPEGFIIPKIEDYATLIRYIKGIENIQHCLLSKEGWEQICPDPYGFNVYPTPEIRYSGQNYFSIKSASFWTETPATKQLNSSMSVDLRFVYGGLDCYLAGYNLLDYTSAIDKGTGLGIRCLLKYNALPN